MDVELEGVIVLLIANILPRMYNYFKSGKLFQLVQVRKIPADPM